MEFRSFLFKHKKIGCWMDMLSIEYKCFRICSIHLTCQSWGGGTSADSKLKSVFQQKFPCGGTLADSKLKSVFQQKFPFGGGVHQLTQNWNLSFNKNFHSGGGYICQWWMKSPKKKFQFWGGTSANWNIYIWPFNDLINY